MKKFNNVSLNNIGLNLLAIFEISQLPQEIAKQLGDLPTDISKYTQLMLIGHSGRKLWNSIDPKNSQSNNPIDDFSVEQVKISLQQNCPQKSFEFIYPGQAPIGLQKLGELAGWHFTSPFKLGINQWWGSWFAYRAVVLINSEFTPTPTKNSYSPCQSCDSKPCISACPVNAMSNGQLNINQCIEYRQATLSLCQDRCLARMACPVEQKEMYSIEQINYHYLQSLNLIRSFSSSLKTDFD